MKPIQLSLDDNITREELWEIVGDLLYLVHQQTSALRTIQNGLRCAETENDRIYAKLEQRKQELKGKS